MEGRQGEGNLGRKEVSGLWFSSNGNKRSMTRRALAGQSSFSYEAFLFLLSLFYIPTCSFLLINAGRSVCSTKGVLFELKPPLCSGMLPNQATVHGMGQQQQRHNHLMTCNSGLLFWSVTTCANKAQPLKHQTALRGRVAVQTRHASSSPTLSLHTTNNDEGSPSEVEDTACEGSWLHHCSSSHHLPSVSGSAVVDGLLAIQLALPST